jgi:hypothetical protein
MTVFMEKLRVNQAKFTCVENIPARCNPLKIVLMVVRFHAINVISLIINWSRSMESGTYKKVDNKGFYYTIFTKANVVITSPVCPGAKNSSSFSPRTDANAFDTAKIRYFVQPFPSRYGLPNFNGILKLIHDRFLLDRNWLWLEPMRACNRLLGSFSLPRLEAQI